MGSEKTDDTSYSITGLWDPKDPALELLNTETDGKDKKVYLTVAVDLVVRGITEPVRLLVETQVRVFHQGERFWYITRKPLFQPFSLNLKEVSFIILILLLNWFLISLIIKVYQLKLNYYSSLIGHVFCMISQSLFKGITHIIKYVDLSFHSFNVSN